MIRVYIFLKITDKYNMIHFEGLNYHFDNYKAMHDDEIIILYHIFILRTKLLLSNRNNLFELYKLQMYRLGKHLILIPIEKQSNGDMLK